MKSTRLFFIYAAAMPLLSVSFCAAQTLALKPAPAAVTIDGNAAEWGDLPYSNPKAKITYTIANDKDNLYLVIKTNDPVEQRDILGSGITFSINTGGKRKAANSITFPIKTDEQDQTVIATLDAELIQTKAEQSKYRKIHPEGFKVIADAELTTSNVYGIQAAIGCEPGGYLVYEEAIPLALFTRTDAAKEWAFNIKINGLQKSERNKPPGTQFPGGSFMITSAEARAYNPNAAYITTSLSPPVDFWGKFILAKQ